MPPGKTFFIVYDGFFVNATPEMRLPTCQGIGGIESDLKRVFERIATRETLGKSLTKVKATKEMTILKGVEGSLHSGNITDRVQRIAVAAEQQSSSTGEVSHNMESIAVITKELKSSFGDIKNSSEGLSQLATELNTMVGWFKV